MVFQQNDKRVLIKPDTPIRLKKKLLPKEFQAVRVDKKIKEQLL